MSRVPSASVLRLLRACLNEQQPVSRHRASQCTAKRPLSTTRTCHHEASTIIPLRKQLKQESKERKALKRSTTLESSSNSSTIPALADQYELTVGLEIHAELNTSRKLFSPAATSLNDTPNAHVSGFDAALPGAQPQFQVATLLPAIRAALALGCDINHTSGWDRKHYFWWDQPQGYQITQYYQPFAVNGSVTLTKAADGVPEDITIGIKQVQMEQDTVKTILQPPSTHLIDFNRVSHPLIEIITLPHIHDPVTAAAFVRKVQKTLKAIGACETGMEMGGLRVDVNVSVKRVEGGGREDTQELHSYAGVSGLGQRTEIKNLATLAGIVTAISLERDRQISVLLAGGRIEGETRGWTLGADSTHRIRGKEGEVDYRYMPDPDLPPLIIGRDLVDLLRETLPDTPSSTISMLVEEWGVSAKDATTMVDLDDGHRVEYFLDVATRLAQLSKGPKQTTGRLAANWVVHEMGAQLASSSAPFSLDAVPTAQLASLLHLLHSEAITSPVAKQLFALCFSSQLLDSTGSPTTIENYVSLHGLMMKEFDDAEYTELASTFIRENSAMTEAVLKALKVAQAREDEKQVQAAIKKAEGKMMWFVGQMVRAEPQRVKPAMALKVVKRVLEKRLAWKDGTM